MNQPRTFHRKEKRPVEYMGIQQRWAPRGGPGCCVVFCPFLLNRTPCLSENHLSFFLSFFDRSSMSTRISRSRQRPPHLTRQEGTPWCCPPRPPPSFWCSVSGWLGFWVNDSVSHHYRPPPYQSRSRTVPFRSVPSSLPLPPPKKMAIFTQNSPLWTCSATPRTAGR